MDNGFYLKTSQAEAEQMITSGINVLFGGIPSKFTYYTYYIEDPVTGDKYFKVENVSYDNIIYDVEGWVNLNFPDMVKYTHEYVMKFIEYDGV